MTRSQIFVFCVVHKYREGFVRELYIPVKTTSFPLALPESCSLISGPTGRHLYGIETHHVLVRLCDLFHLEDSVYRDCRFAPLNSADVLLQSARWEILGSSTISCQSDPIWQKVCKNRTQPCVRARRMKFKGITHPWGRSPESSKRCSASR